MEIVPSLLMCVGEAHYTLAEFVDEAREMGVSKRLPLTAVPMGLQPGLSKIFLAHSKAILKVTNPGYTLMDLSYTLLDEGVLTQAQWDKLVELEQPFWTGQKLHADDFVPTGMLVIAIAFSRLPAKRQRELTDDFKLEFCMGIFGYSPVDGLQMVLDKNETALPPEMAHLEGYVEPVHVRYINDDGDELEDTDEEEE